MATKALNYTAAEINQRLNLAGTAVQPSALNSYYTKTEVDGKVVVDISTRYSASYANLSAALTALNSDTAADATAIKKGGVSIKFINSSTNKYEQWNLKASSWSTNASDWALDVNGSVTNGKLKLPFELEKPSSNEYVTQASEVGYGNSNIKEELDRFQVLNQRIVDSITTMDTTQCTNASTANKYIDVDGVVTTTDGTAWRVTDEIDIDGAYRIVCSVAKAKATSSALTVAFYDASHTFISGSQSYVYDGGIPTNAKYVRVSFRKYTNDTVSLSSYTHTYDASCTAEDVSYNDSDVKAALDTNLPKIDEAFGVIDERMVTRYVTKDKVQLTSISTSERVLNTDGELVTRSGGTAWYVSDEIDVDGAISLTYEVSYIESAQNDLVIAFYNTSHTFISGSNSLSGTINIPETAKYLRMAFRKFQNSDVANISILYKEFNIADDVTPIATSIATSISEAVANEKISEMEAEMFEKKAFTYVAANTGKRLGFDGKEKSHETSVLSDYIKIDNQTIDSVSLCFESSYGLAIAFYSAPNEESFISGYSSTDGLTNLFYSWYKGTLTNVAVPQGTLYVRYVGNTTLAPNSNSITCKKYANDGGNGKAEAPSNAYTNPIDSKSTNYEFISYNVDCTVPDVEDSVHSTSVIPKVISEDQALIHLPNSYTSSNKPTRLVICNHGAGGAVKLSSGSIVAEGWKSQFTNRLLANDYAVLYVNGVPETFRNTKYLDAASNGYATHMGSWMFMRSVYAAYKYVIGKYNICTDGVFVAGQSMGGLASINLVNAGVLPVKGMLIDAPVINAYRDAYFSGGWSGGTLGGRTAAIFAWVYQWEHCDWETDKYTIDGETWKDLANLKDNGSDMAALWDYNKQKMVGYNGYTAGQMLIANIDNSYVNTIESSNDNEENYWGIKFPCPVRIYFDSLDATNQCTIAEKWIKKLRNAGTLAAMRSVEIATNDHCILNKEVSGEYPFAIDAINWLNQHNG